MDMNTRSKTVSADLKSNPHKDTFPSHKNYTMADSIIPKNIADLSVDEKLNFLINSVTKLETVPHDIEKVQKSITGIQKDLKAIPILEEKVKKIEESMKTQKKDIDSGKVATTALETSVTDTQKDVDELNKKLKDMQGKMDTNIKMFKDFEKKIKQDEDKIEELSKKSLKEEIEKSEIAKKIQIQGVPENRLENLPKIVQQVLFDTGVKVHPLEIDEAYREGNFNKHRTRPIIVTLTKSSTRNEIIRNRNNIKRNPHCKNVWINEVVHDRVKQQRNELHAIHLLALNNGHQSKHVLDILTIDGLIYCHSTLHKLPNDLTLEKAFSREHNNHIYFNSEHIFMSNFHPCEIELEDVTCSSLEQAYFYIMAKDIGDLRAAKLILETQLPRQIKKIGARLNVTQKWIEKSPQVMYDLLKIKYGKNPALKAKLLATGNKRLIESTMNKTWGCGLTIPMIDKMIAQHGIVKFPGKNLLGSQTEDVRRDLQSE